MNMSDDCVVQLYDQDGSCTATLSTSIPGDFWLNLPTEMIRPDQKLKTLFETEVEFVTSSIKYPDVFDLL